MRSENDDDAEYTPQVEGSEWPALFHEGMLLQGL